MLFRSIVRLVVFSRAWRRVGSLVIVLEAVLDFNPPEKMYAFAVSLGGAQSLCIVAKKRRRSEAIRLKWNHEDGEGRVENPCKDLNCQSAVVADTVTRFIVQDLNFCSKDNLCSPARSCLSRCCQTNASALLSCCLHLRKQALAGKGDNLPKQSRPG